MIKHVEVLLHISMSDSSSKAKIKVKTRIKRKTDCQNIPVSNVFNHTPFCQLIATSSPNQVKEP